MSLIYKRSNYERRIKCSESLQNLKTYPYKKRGDKNIPPPFTDRHDFTVLRCFHDADNTISCFNTILRERNFLKAVFMSNSFNQSNNQSVSH